MKKGTLKYISSLIIVLFSISSLAQSPEKFAYQAVVRDATNLLLANQLVGVQITILQGVTPVYVERHTLTTNMNALVSVEVGIVLTPELGVFADIDWGTGTYYIKADIDPSGGTSYTITGNEQLMSVPYAFYAKEAENGFSGDFNDLTNKPDFDGTETKLVAGSKVTITGTGESGTPYMVSAIVPVSGFEHYIGEPMDDGIVFYVYVGKDGLEYDLIVHPSESAALTWENSFVLRNANRTYDGVYNMNLMSQPNSQSKTYVVGLGSGWYLPSVDELSLLYQNRFLVSKGLEGIAGTALTVASGANDPYWSSTEYASNFAYYMNFGTGEISHGNTKSQNRRVRAIRKVEALIGTPYQGGVIAYIFKPGDPGYVAGQFHGIVATIGDIGNAPWGCFGTEITGADATALGTGSQNTLDILAGCADLGTAARICADWENVETGTGVYTDWFLPTTGELFKLETNKRLIGGFASTAYWSSREGAMGVNAYYVHFGTGSSSEIPKTSNQPVRPIRYF